MRIPPLLSALFSSVVARLAHINTRLEHELTEPHIVASPVSRASSILPPRSPAVQSSALPTTSPSGFSVRNSGERDMDISSTPLHPSVPLPDVHLPDFGFFFVPTHPPTVNDPSANLGPPRHSVMNSIPPGAWTSDSTDRPSSAPPNINNFHLPVVLSPFQLSLLLPPRSKSAEPPLQPKGQNSGS